MQQQQQQIIKTIGVVLLLWIHRTRSFNACKVVDMMMMNLLIFVHICIVIVPIYSQYLFYIKYEEIFNQMVLFQDMSHLY